MIRNVNPIPAAKPVINLNPLLLSLIPYNCVNPSISNGKIIITPNKTVRSE